MRYSQPISLLTSMLRESIHLFLPCGSNSVVECNLAKVEVAGSNPVSRSIFFTPHCGSNSAVECQLPKLKVAGSNPVSRSRNLKGLHRTM